MKSRKFINIPRWTREGEETIYTIKKCLSRVGKIDTRATKTSNNSTRQNPKYTCMVGSECKIL